jgi:amino acid adenylation domain-containing protein
MSADLNHESAADEAYVFPLSFAQERLWFLEQLQPGNGAYLIPVSLRFQVPLDPATLEWSLNEVVRRHEVLRTRFMVVEGLPAQVVLPALWLPLPVHDLGAEPEERRLAETQRLTWEEWRQPFDISSGPLLRARLLRLGERDWLLVMTLHHLVADGWAVGILERELVAFYDARITGGPAPLAPLRLQYADYAVWQRDRLEGAELERQLGYWRQRLAGAPALLNLPTDRPRPATQSLRGGTWGLTVDRGLLERLKAVGQGSGATLFMVLLAAFALLLQRYARQDEVMIGSPIAGRLRSELEKLIGLFTNTLALRLDLSGGPTFRELLRRVRDVTLEAFEHQELPFERLVEELRPERNLSYNPLFQVMFTLQNVPTARGGSGGGPGQAGEMVAAGAGAAKFDLSLSMAEGEGGLWGALEYSSDLFEAESAARLAERLVVLLAGIAAEPDLPVWRLPLMGEDERRQVTAEWNRTAGPLPRRPLHESFAEVARRSGDAVALIFGRQEMTYGDLERRANQVAHRLRASGVGPDVLVALCLERSLELVAGLLGVLKAGGAYVPLDPSYPRERLDFMLDDAGAGVLLTQRALVERLPQAGLEVICLDDEEELAGQPGHGLDAGATLDHLAYVIYTSGSTGRPKGVAVAHRAIANHMLWMGSEHPLAPEDRVLQKTPFSFDASIWEFWAPLLAGAGLVLARPEGHRDPAYLVDAVLAHGITTLQVVPTLLQALVDEPSFPRCTSLRRLYCGGEALSAALAERVLALLGSVALYNLYGPTEAAIDTTAGECLPPFSGPRVPIGRPIANVRAYVLDRHGLPVPPGIPGEIHVGGLGLARGYLRRPALTAERFVPDPFGGEPGARLYRTGDLGRHLPDSRLEFLERLDSQVKLRGYRVELGEIEAQVARLPGVREAAVQVREDRPGDSRLVAYVALADGAPPPGISDLRDFLVRQLPEFMIPTALVVLAALPLSPSGKLDRGALPPPERGTVSPRVPVEPRNDVEAVVAGVWAQVLGLESVGVEDDFFELGGHSLLGTQVVARLRDAFDIDLPLRVLFESRIPAAMAAALVAPPADAARLEKTAAILMQLARMSDAEVEEQLSSHPAPER